MLKKKTKGYQFLVQHGGNNEGKVWCSQPNERHWHTKRSCLLQRLMKDGDYKLVRQKGAELTQIIAKLWRIKDKWLIRNRLMKI